MTSSISANLNSSPYWDDFDETKNFHQVLFRPSVPVQARELTTLQTILQNQISRFGDNIFVDGTIIQGCNFHFDTTYNYIKLPDLRVDGQPVQVTQYVGLIAYDASSNLQALVVNSTDGYESQNPDLKTLYIKYLNSGSSSLSTFSPTSTLTFYSNTVTVGNYQASLDVKVASTLSALGVAQNPVGTGYAFTVGEGIIFQKGHFIRVANNITSIISKYSASPNNVSVGFTTAENIVTDLTDTSLLDNSQGSSNYTAPGAHRLQLIPSLLVSNTYGVFTNNSGTYVNTAVSAIPSNNFLSIVTWQSGNPIRQNQDTQYNKIGNEMARREYESAGNYVVSPFSLGTETNPQTKDYFNLVIGSGLGYVGGFRVQQYAPARYVSRKGTDTKTLTYQSLPTYFGNYIRVQDVAGSIPVGNTVTFYSSNSVGITKGANSTGGYSITPVGTVIGTGLITGIQYESGTVDTNTAIYDVYLTNITMNSGQSFASVKSIVVSNGSANTATADLIPEFNSTLNANVATIKYPNYSQLVFPLAKPYIKSLSNTSFNYRTTGTITFTSGVGTKTLGGSAQYSYGSGSVSPESSIILVPQTAVNTGLTYVGTTSTTSGSNVVTGSSTTFTTQYQINDYLAIGNTTNIPEYKRIMSIANNTYLTVSNNYTNTYSTNSHSKTYPGAVPINLQDRVSTTVVSGAGKNILTINLLAANGTQETPSFTGVITYDTLAPANTATQKTINKNTLVCIDTGLYAPLQGTVSCNVSSPIVNGTSTYFNSTVQAGYKLYSGNTTSPVLLGTVSSITNSTSLTLLTNSTTTLVTNTVYYNPPNPIGPTGPWSLGLPDVVKLRNVFKVTQNTAYSTSSTTDVTSEFGILTNQTDSLYNISQLTKRPTSGLVINNGDKLTVQFDNFSIPNPNSVNYFTVNSYPIDDANTANTSAIQTVDIPFYKTSTGQTISLRDSIDFRPYVNNAILTVNSLPLASNSSQVNPGINNTVGANVSFVSPVYPTTYDSQYYLGRTDKITVNSDGIFSVIEGQASENPTVPQDQTGTMAIGTLTIPPYPSLLPTQALQVSYPFPMVTYSITQPRKYSMADIGKLDQRLQNIEYYTTLSLLEVNTKNLTIKNTTTGLDRFKNGIFVDTFDTNEASNITDPEYSIGKDTTEASLVPVFHQFNLGLKYDYNTNGVANTTTHMKTGDLVTLPYTNVPYITQTNATRVRNATQGYYNWRGTAMTTPQYDSYAEARLSPTQQTSGGIGNYTAPTILTNQSINVIVGPTANVVGYQASMVPTTVTPVYSSPVIPSIDPYSGTAETFNIQGSNVSVNTLETLVKTTPMNTTVLLGVPTGFQKPTDIAMGRIKQL